METKLQSSQRRDILDRNNITDWEKKYRDRFGARYDEYRRLWESANKAEILTPYPLEVAFEISDRCNFACVHCPRNAEFTRQISFDLNKKGVAISLDVYKRIIDEAAASGCMSVSFSTGAEALLEKNLGEYLAYARQKDILDVRVTSNGFLLNEKNIRSLVDNETTFLGISIDAATPETYKAIRKHDLKVIHENIRNLLAYRDSLGKVFPILRISFVKMKQNIHEMPAFLEYWRDKADIVDFQDFYTFEHCELEAARKKNFFCYQPWLRASVWADGNVTLCCSWTAQRAGVGNVHKRSVKEIWNSEESVAFRKTLLDQNYLDACLWCVASTEKTTCAV